MKKMKISRDNLKLKLYQYLISPDSPDAKHYDIFFKGKKLNDVWGLIRIGGYPSSLFVRMKENEKKQ